MFISVNNRHDGIVRVSTYQGTRPDPDNEIHRDAPAPGGDSRLDSFVDVCVNDGAASIEDVAVALEAAAAELRRRGDELLGR